MESWSGRLQSGGPGTWRKETLDTSLHFVISSDFAEGREVQDRILEELGRYHYYPDATFAIRLALEEAIIKKNRDLIHPLFRTSCCNLDC